MYSHPLFSSSIHPPYCRRQLSLTAKKPTKTNTQKASLQEKRNALAIQVKRWRQLQLVYMPGVSASSLPTYDNDTDENEEKAEDTPLILPSDLEPTQRSAICQHRVAEHEERFRLAQLEDSLVELRRTRRIRRTLIMNHRFQIAGQGRRANTRSRIVIDSIQGRINKLVHRYRAAYQALFRLSPSGNWRETYLELKECDNRGPGKEVEEEGVGDGSYAPSWIWLSNPRARNPIGAMDPEESATDEEVNDAIRVEWATSFARLERWTEEIELLQEEMRRVVTFLEWKSNDWLSKRGARSTLVTCDIQSGLDAYTRKQAAVYRDLSTSFATLWRPTLASYNLNLSWATECLQRHGISLADTPAPRNPGFFEHQTVSNMTHSQIDQLATPLTPHIHDPPGAHNVDDGISLDEADPDSLTDTSSSDSDEFEGEGDDDDDDDEDSDFDFE